MKKKNDEPSVLLSLINFILATFAISMMILALGVMMDQAGKPQVEPRVDIKVDMPKAQANFVHKITQIHSIWVGTGFDLKYGQQVITVTNAHVCSDGESETGIRGKHLKVDGRVEQVIAMRLDYDLCLITNSTQTHLGLTLAPQDYKVDTLEPVYTIGFPEGLFKDIRVGRILHYDPAGGRDAFGNETSAQVLAGQSGSPVFNQDNQVIAVIWGHQLGGTEGTVKDNGLFVPLEQIREFVKYELYGLGRDQ